jgi:hypothetical protein
MNLPRPYTYSTFPIPLPSRLDHLPVSSPVFYSRRLIFGFYQSQLECLLVTVIEMALLSVEMVLLDLIWPESVRFASLHVHAAARLCSGTDLQSEPTFF